MFKTQLSIEFVVLFTGCRKVLGKMSTKPKITLTQA